MTVRRAPLITVPSAAYAADVVLRGGSAQSSPLDEAWLALAHALHSLGQQSSEHEARSDAVAASLAGSAIIEAEHAKTVSTLGRAVDSLRAVAACDPQDGGTTTTLAGLTAAIRAVAEEQEVAGVLHLAYATLHCFTRAFRSRISPQDRGEILVQQGRALRALGDNDRAREHYERAVDIGYGYNLPVVTSRALCGLGSLALTLGSYPSARDLFSRALADAERTANPALIRAGHHGLQVSGLLSGDFDTALVHGWTVLRLCVTSESRAEALMNLAEVCRLTDEHDAALRAYDTVLAWTSQDRVRVHAVSSAALSALAVGRRELALQYERELRAVLPTISDTFTRASVGLEYSVVLSQLGQPTAAAEQRALALVLASAHQYQALLHRAKQQESLTVDALRARSRAALSGRPTAVERSVDFRMVLTSISRLREAAI